MKILWIVNTVFPAVCIAKKIAPTVIGGWMYETANALSCNEDIQLTVATTHVGSELEFYQIDNIDYWLLPSNSTIIYDSSLRRHWVEVFETVKPTIVHIHGTEFTHGLVALDLYPNLNFIVSIQGLVSVYWRYYIAGMSTIDVLKNLGLRDLLKGSLFKEQKNFKRRGKFEIDYLLKCKNVIGRTDWDYAHVKTVNPSIQYFFCNESLRRSFYDVQTWNVKEMVPFSIFLSQAGYPIKGLHQVLKAVFLLKEQFPKIQIRVGGYDILRSNENFGSKLRITGYARYIRSLIKKFNLQENVKFVGLIGEEKMIEEYRRAHVFICPSSIENSPNSIGEAQMIGTPVIASYTGGIPNMITHFYDGLLYRFEEIEMLSMHIRSIFVDESLALKLSHNGKNSASDRHNVARNTEHLISIYTDIIKRNGRWR